MRRSTAVHTVRGFRLLGRLGVVWLRLGRESDCGYRLFRICARGCTNADKWVGGNGVGGGGG